MEQSTKAAAIELERRAVAHAKSPADISKKLKGRKWKDRSLPTPKKPRFGGKADMVVAIVHCAQYDLLFNLFAPGVDTT